MGPEYWYAHFPLFFFAAHVRQPMAALTKQRRFKMERYYDLVMANALQKYARKNGMPGVAPEGASEEERWEAVKRELSGSRLGVITEWGFIDFDPDGLKNLVGGEGMSYEEYLELQKASANQVRHDLEKAYYENCWIACKGRIEKSSKAKGRICFERLYLGAFSCDGNGFVGKEDHVWMKRRGFEDYQVGTSLSFTAEIYRYVKTGNGKMLDFGLRNPREIREIEAYDLPTDEALELQDADQFICRELCLYKDHCNGTACLADEAWRETMRKFII